MKNFLKIILLFFTCILNAQEGVIVSYKNYEDVANGTYLKDIDNELNPFIGTYVGHWDNKRFTLILQKMEQITNTSPNGDYYYEDRMVGKYEIVSDVDNSVLYTTMDVTEYDDFPIFNMGGVYNDDLDFNFYDSDERCNKVTELRLYKLTSQSGITTVKYWGRIGEYATMRPDCLSVNSNSIPNVLPIGFLTLTKVN